MNIGFSAGLIGGVGRAVNSGEGSRFLHDDSLDCFLVFDSRCKFSMGRGWVSTGVFSHVTPVAIIHVVSFREFLALNSIPSLQNPLHPARIAAGVAPYNAPAVFIN